MTSVTAARREPAPRSVQQGAPAFALTGGAVALLALLAAIPLAVVAHRLSHALPLVFAAVPFAAVGCLVAYRQPRNPVGWLMLVLGISLLVSIAAIAYSLLRYQLGHTGLPLGPAAAFLTPLEWAPILVLLPLPVLLFPDGQLTRPWRFVMWTYEAIAVVWLLGIFALDVDGLVRPLEIDSSGSFRVVDTPPAAWERFVTDDFVTIMFLALAIAAVVRQVLAFRGSTGERRQQLKWLLGSGAVCFIGLSLTLSTGNGPTGLVLVLSDIGLVTVAAVPIGFGIAILKYRLYDIDRIISRTISYTIVTGILVGLFAVFVLLATRALPFSSPVGVAAATLAAAALFNPLRRRTQRLVDRRFNRARYDAEATVAAFTERLRNAVDPETIRSELLKATSRTLEPAQSSIWIRR